ncbi:hypothetical protein BLX88_04610, partial [Bacillus obstructivus]
LTPEFFWGLYFNKLYKQILEKKIPPLKDVPIEILDVKLVGNQKKRFNKNGHPRKIKLKEYGEKKAHGERKSGG